MRSTVVMIVICGSLLTGCAGPGPSISPRTVSAVSQSRSRRAQATYRLIYAFPSHRAGAYPYGSLFSLKGTLYGTTLDGGSQCGSLGCGTVFSLSLKSSVKETVLHSFANSPDGWTPYSGVTALGGTIYGTTVRGGEWNGAVYGVDLRSGLETVVHDFGRTRDGRSPIGGMAAVGRALYGTTSAGYDGRGSVFSLDSSGREAVLYRFKGRPDGAIPKGDLLAVGNVLYGTTEAGGSNPAERCSRNRGCGTIFSITLGPSGAHEAVLYRFRGGEKDGAVPLGGLIFVHGILYGVTASGGVPSCVDFDVTGCGTVFSLNPSTGQEIPLHEFQGEGDTEFPVGNLAHRNGTLYGVTYGAVFSLKLDGSEYAILHRFLGGRNDGWTPEAGLVLSNGIIYGTTGYGGGGKGCHSGGCGTIFSITPP